MRGQPGGRDTPRRRRLGCEKGAGWGEGQASGPERGKRPRAVESGKSRCWNAGSWREGATPPLLRLDNSSTVGTTVSRKFTREPARTVRPAGRYWFRRQLEAGDRQSAGSTGQRDLGAGFHVQTGLLRRVLGRRAPSHSLEERRRKVLGAARLLGSAPTWFPLSSVVPSVMPDESCFGIGSFLVSLPPL